MERKDSGSIPNTREVPFGKLGHVLITALKRFWHDNIVANDESAMRMQNIDDEVSGKPRPPKYVSKLKIRHIDPTRRN